MTSQSLMYALKLFLPSWNFFNDFAAVPRLEYQLLRAPAPESNWQPVYADHNTTNLRRIFLNPQGNLALLEKSLIDRAATDLTPPSAVAQSRFASSAACASLQRLVRSRLPGSTDIPAAETFRFRLLLLEPAAQPEILFVSEPISVCRP